MFTDLFNLIFPTPHKQALSEEKQQVRQTDPTSWNARDIILDDFYLIPTEKNDGSTHSNESLNDRNPQQLFSDDNEKCMQIEKIAMEKIHIQPEFKLSLKEEDCTSESELLQILGGHKELLSINIPGLRISDTTLKYIAAHYPNLQVLDVSGCMELTKKGFDDLAEGCKNIKKLNTSFLDLRDGDFNMLLAANENLLKWTVSRKEYWGSRLGSKTLQQLSNNKHLRVLIAERWTGNADSLLTLIHGCSSLKKLVINDWPLINNECLAEIAKHGKNLKLLDISGRSAFITTSGVKDVLRTKNKGLVFKFQNLPYVDLNDPQLISLM